MGPSGNPSNADEYNWDLTNNGAHAGWSVATTDNLFYLVHPALMVGAPDEAPSGSAVGGVTVWVLYGSP